MNTPEESQDLLAEDRSTANQSLQHLPLGIGICLMLIGLAGVLDDGGALPHRWWVPLAAVAMLASLAVVASVAARLRGELG